MLPYHTGMKTISVCVYTQNGLEVGISCGILAVKRKELSG